VTIIHSFDQFVDEIREYRESKDTPEEWYVLRGEMVTEYAVYNDYGPREGDDEIQQAMPPEDRDGSPPVEGYFQIGAAGWLASSFDFDDDSFITELHFGDEIERNLLNLLVVHESVLSEELLGAIEDKPEAAADVGEQS
jgi:hypothetical protein